MALDHAILVSLAERSASGYDLTRRFDRSIGFFWRATHQQIYRVLARMESAGWVDVTPVPQAGRPDKKLYAINAAGRAELKRWSATPSEPEPIRSELAVKVRGIAHGDRDVVLDEVHRHRELHAERLAYYEKDAERWYPDPDRLGDDERPGWLVLQGGIAHERMLVDWCDRILATLGPAGDRQAGDSPAGGGS
jgi:DNA-binding PadR family transcriptional regulator